jgi:hypothetical protein
MIFYSSFPLKRVKNETKSKSWIIVGIKTSCKSKTQLYLVTRDSNDPRLKSHYKMYCKILSKVIKEAKRNNYNSQIIESNNKIKTTWEIVKDESGKKIINEDVQVLNIDGKATNSPQAIASAFNEYFLSLVEKIYFNNNNNNNNDNINNNPIYYLSHAFNISYPNINLKFTTTKEIENIILPDPVR